jgi:predicted MFS family arabinose efflux permease
VTFHWYVKGRLMPDSAVGIKPPVVETRIGDLALARGIWLLLLAQFLSNLPGSAAGIFLPVMASDLGRSVALVGGLRSLGGVAALACGVLAAPLIDRIARAWTIVGGLLLLAVAALLAALGNLPSLALFYLLLGAAGAVCQPALQSAAADGLNASTGARAAALMSAMAALSPMLGGPLLAATAGLIGWRGDYLGNAVLLILVAVLAGATFDRRPPAGVARVGYRAAFRLVAAAPGALPLLLGSTMRAIVQFAWLSYLAAVLVERFAASTVLVAVVWGMGGTCFFLANLAVGRVLGAAASDGWRSPARLLPASLIAMTALLPLGLLVPTLPLAMVMAALGAGTHGAAVAVTISLLVGRYAPLRGAVLGLNAAGLNLGLFAGAALGGAALAAGGYRGLALALAIMAGTTLTVSVWALRRAPHPAL